MYISLGLAGAESKNFSRGMVGRVLGGFQFVTFVLVYFCFLLFLKKVCIESGEKEHKKETIKKKYEEES